MFWRPDQVDRYRAVTFGDAPDGKKGDPRPLQAPGAYWEYNDVRINILRAGFAEFVSAALPGCFAKPSCGP